MNRFEFAGEIDGSRLFVLVIKQVGEKVQFALLFSTDLELTANDIVRFYKARFQIEFLFRDAKQFLGL